MPPVSLAPTDAEVAESVAELRTIVGKLRRKLQEQASGSDFTLSQISVCTRLHTEGPSTLTALARAEGMRPQSMSAIISALEATGFVQGTPDPSDGRQTILSLTDRARDTAAAVQAAKDDWLVRAIRTRLSDDEQADLARSIPLLKRITET
jgi:DNA-binding MarR family transcriptional regulator